MKKNAYRAIGMALLSIILIDTAQGESESESLFQRYDNGTRIHSKTDTGLCVSYEIRKDAEKNDELAGRVDKGSACDSISVRYLVQYRVENEKCQMYSIRGLLESFRPDQLQHLSAFSSPLEWEHVGPISFMNKSVCDGIFTLDASIYDTYEQIARLAQIDTDINDVRKTIENADQNGSMRGGATNEALTRLQQLEDDRTDLLLKARAIIASKTYEDGASVRKVPYSRKLSEKGAKKK
ncbi:MAG: hypothetical protein AB1540_00525 [Bdellovibrionota bacterium]